MPPKTPNTKPKKRSRLSEESQYKILNQDTEDKTKAFLKRPSTRQLSKDSTHRITRLNTPKTITKKRIKTEPIPDFSLRKITEWAPVIQRMPGVEDEYLEVHTKNWRTAIQIKLGVLGYLYDKISDGMRMEDAIRGLQTMLKKRKGERMEMFTTKFDEFAEKTGKNLLVSFAFIIVEDEYRIIDISDQSKVINLFDPNTIQAQDLCEMNGRAMNAQRDFHTEASACAELPLIIKKALVDLGFITKSGKTKQNQKPIEKIYLYLDSTKSSCNPCVEKIRHTQEEHRGFMPPLSILFGYHTKHSGSMGIAGDLETHSNGNSSPVRTKRDGAVDEMSPIRFSSTNHLVRSSPHKPRQITAKKQSDSGEMQTLLLKSRAYISGSETFDNKKIQSLFDTNKDSIDKLVSEFVDKFFNITPKISYGR